MRRRGIWLIPVVGFLLVMAGCDACSESQPTGPTSLVVNPPGPITLQVGQTVTIHADAIINGNPSFASFASSNPAVATVDSATGLVRCVNPGNATVTVTGGGTAQPVAIACTSAVLIEAAPATLAFTHTVGVTSCPNKFGTIRVSNVASSAVSVTLTSSSAALILNAGTGSIPTGAALDFDVFFNCSVESSFTANIAIVGTSGVATDAKNVTVQATVGR